MAVKNTPNSSEPGEAQHKSNQDSSADGRRHTVTGETLLHSPDLYAELYAAAPIAYCVLNRRGDIVDVNRMASLLLGESSQSLLNRSFYCFFSEVDALRIQDWISHLDHSPNKSLQLKLNKTDGSYCWVLLQISSLNTQAEDASILMALTDLSENHQIQESLSRTRELLERTGELAKIGGWEVNLETMKLTWSLTTFRIAEIEPPHEPALDQGINLFAPEARPVIAEAIQRTIDTGEHYDLELPLITAKGRHIWVRTQGYAVIQDGKVAYLRGTFQDITERRAAEREQEQTKGRLQATLDAIPDLLFEVGEDKILYDYHAHRTDFLLTHPNIELGKSITQSLPVEAATICSQALETAVATQQPSSGQYSIHLPEKDFWFEFTITPIARREGQDSRFILLIHDISANKIAETALVANQMQLANMISAAMDAIITTDVHFNIILFNRAAETMFGYSSSEVLGKPLNVLIPKTVATGHNHLMTEFALRGESTRKMRSGSARQVSGLRATGEEFPIEVSISYSENFGRPIFTAMVRDITDRLAHENSLLEFAEQLEQRVASRTRELEEAKQLAEQASQAKSSFLANMSHEIRTPLNSILGMTYLAQQHELEPKPRDYLDKIALSGTHLLGLINDILDFSKIEAGQLHLDSVDFNLAQVLKELQELLGAIAAQKNLKLLFVIDPQLSSARHGDDLRLKQVLINLLSNAIKFTEYGSVTLLVNRDLQHLDQDVIQFVIRDTGIGISVDAQTRLFQSFQQADNSNTRKYGGTGLGLAISQQLVRLMGGELQLQSQIGLGSEFRFAIPLPLANEAPKTIARRNEAIKDHHNLLSGKRILLVDDHPFNQQVGEDLLKIVGAEVVIAGNGLEAVEIAQKQHFDAILMDVQMPIMDGITATETLCKSHNWQQTPIIAMTANVLKEDRQRCLAAGMIDFIRKPVQPEKLYTTLARCLNITLASAALVDEKDSELLRLPSAVEWLDLDVMATMLGADPERQKRFVNKFIEAMSAGLQALDQALSEKNCTQIHRECHRLKSIAGTIGAVVLASELSKLESKAKSEDYHLDVDLQKIHECYKATVDQLHQNGLTDVDIPNKTLDVPAPNVVVSASIDILIVDDDAFILELLQQQLCELGFHPAAFQSASSALEYLAQQPSPPWLICDLQMPTMDGIELLRQLGLQSYQGNVIILSGMDNPVLTAAQHLADSFSVSIAGVLAKPPQKDALEYMLRQSGAHGHSSPASKPIALEPLSAEDIRDGLDHGALELYYQPKVSTNQRVVIGAECLARWHHPARGLVGPDQFVPVIERLGLIDELTYSVLNQAAHQLRLWSDQGIQMHLSINVSMDNLCQLELPEQFDVILQEYGVSPKSITLEITETQITHDFALSLDILTRLRIKGFGLSIDDFGTGFSTMEHLLKTPFTELKIDKAFVRGASENRAAQILLEHSITLGQQFDLNLVAEGVETEQDWNLVAQMGCHEIQGFLVARPMSASAFIEWKKHWENKS